MALISMNFDKHCTIHVPTVTQVFRAMTPLGYIFLSVAILLAIFTFLVFLDELFYIHIKVPYKTHKERLYWLIGIFPVFSLTSFLGICVPRSGVLVDFVASVYLSIAIFQFFQLIVEYFGGKSSMLEILADTPVPLNSPPLACCFPCLPAVPFVKKNFIRLKAIVFQTAIVRPILIFIAAVLWTDGSYTPGQISFANAYLYLTILTSISTFIGMYGLVIMFRMSKHWLREHHLVAKFISIQLVLIFSNLQGSILELLATKNILPCVAPLYTKTRGMELNHLLLVMECFVLSVLLHHYYRKEALHGGPQLIEDFDQSLENVNFPTQLSLSGEQKKAARCHFLKSIKLRDDSPSFKKKMHELKHAIRNNYITQHHHHHTTQSRLSNENFDIISPNMTLPKTTSSSISTNQHSTTVLPCKSRDLQKMYGCEVGEQNDSLNITDERQSPTPPSTISLSSTSPRSDRNLTKQDRVPHLAPEYICAGENYESVENLQLGIESSKIGENLSKNVIRDIFLAPARKLTLVSVLLAQQHQIQELRAAASQAEKNKKQHKRATSVAVESLSPPSPLKSTSLVRERRDEGRKDSKRFNFCSSLLKGISVPKSLTNNNPDLNQDRSLNNLPPKTIKNGFTSVVNEDNKNVNLPNNFILS